MTTVVQTPDTIAETASGHSLRKLPLALLAAAALAAIGNSVVRLITVAAIEVDPGFLPLTVGAPIVSSVVAAIGAAVVFAALVRWTTRPVRNFWIASLITFVVTFAPLVNIATGDNPDPGLTGGTPGAFGALALMHLVALLVIVPTLIRLTRTRAAERDRSVASEKG